MINKSYSYLIPIVNEFCNIDPAYFILVDQSYAMVNGSSEEPFVVLSYQKADNQMFLEYLEELKASPITRNVIESEDRITFVFEIPEEYIHEYKSFINGKFSAFSQKAKDLIVDYVTSYHKAGTAKKVKMVLYREDELRKYLENKLAVKLDADLDLSSIPKVEEESFNYDIV